MKIGDKIAVYGTLRPGFAAARKMEQGARHLGQSTIIGKIYELGWFPGLKLDGAGPEDKVVVDVFEISDLSLVGRLDAYEGYPSLYDRRQVQTEGGDLAWVYTFNGTVKEQDRVMSGDWAHAEREAGRAHA